MPKTMDRDRRRFLLVFAAAAGFLPLIRMRAALAAEELAEDDELAQQLGYVTEASRADTERFPKRAEPGGDQQFCRSCQFYKGDADSESGACVVFGGRTVRAGGWCSSWFKKAG